MKSNPHQAKEGAPNYPLWRAIPFDEQLCQPGGVIKPHRRTEANAWLHSCTPINPWIAFRLLTFAVVFRIKIQKQKKSKQL
jgi:hypothetical protein